MKIDELDFTVRTYNTLKRGGIDTVEELAKLSDDELMKIRNFGSRCLMEVHEKLGRASSSEPPTGCVCVSITNGDRIRAMSDEELAKFIVGNAVGEEYQTYEFEFSIENVRYFNVGYEHQKKTAEDSVLYWLQQPAEVSQNG